MYFVDRNKFNDVYIANGALVDSDKVLTTHNFLINYQNGVENKDLYVYSPRWKTVENQMKKVIKVYIEKAGGYGQRGDLAVAIVSIFTRSY